MGAPPSLELSPRHARRIAVRAQLLAAPRVHAELDALGEWLGLEVART